MANKERISSPKTEAVAEQSKQPQESLKDIERQIKNLKEPTIADKYEPAEAYKNRFDVDCKGERSAIAFDEDDEVHIISELPNAIAQSGVLQSEAVKGDQALGRNLKELLKYVAFTDARQGELDAEEEKDCLDSLERVLSYTKDGSAQESAAVEDFIDVLDSECNAMGVLLIRLKRRQLEQTAADLRSRKTAPKPAQKSAPKSTPKPAPKPVPAPTTKPVSKPVVKPTPKPAPKAVEKPAPKPAEKPQPKVVEMPKPAAKPKVERVPKPKVEVPKAVKAPTPKPETPKNVEAPKPKAETPKAETLKPEAPKVAEAPKPIVEAPKVETPKATETPEPAEQPKTEREPRWVIEPSDPDYYEVLLNRGEEADEAEDAASDALDELNKSIEEVEETHKKAARASEEASQLLRSGRINMKEAKEAVEVLEMYVGRLSGAINSAEVDLDAAMRAAKNARRYEGMLFDYVSITEYNDGELQKYKKAYQEIRRNFLYLEERLNTLKKISSWD